MPVQCSLASQQYAPEFWCRHRVHLDASTGVRRLVGEALPTALRPDFRVELVQTNRAAVTHEAAALMSTGLLSPREMARVSHNIASLNRVMRDAVGHPVLACPPGETALSALAHEVQLLRQEAEETRLGGHARPPGVEISRRPLITGHLSFAAGVPGPTETRRPSESLSNPPSPVSAPPALVEAGEGCVTRCDDHDIVTFLRQAYLILYAQCERIEAEMIELMRVCEAAVDHADALHMPLHADGVGTATRRAMHTLRQTLGRAAAHVAEQHGVVAEKLREAQTIAIPLRLGAESSKCCGRHPPPSPGAVAVKNPFSSGQTLRVAGNEHWTLMRDFFRTYLDALETLLDASIFNAYETLLATIDQLEVQCGTPADAWREGFAAAQAKQNERRQGRASSS
jgi:hypothetical protein